MFVKRGFDLFFALSGLVVLSPVLLIVALVVKLDSKGSILFRQKRVGLYGGVFHVLKFRTMVMDAEKKGAKVTTEGDSRVTEVGYFLRAYKFDELPQLFNVLKGDMSLVGPRPEVPEYVKFYPADVKKIVLSVRPGITDKAAIAFRDESKILANSSDPVRDYREKVLPIKLEFYQDYVKNQSLGGDFILIIRTFSAILR